MELVEDSDEESDDVFTPTSEQAVNLEDELMGKGKGNNGSKPLRVSARTAGPSSNQKPPAGKNVKKSTTSVKRNASAMGGEGGKNPEKKINPSK